ncbi:methyltransferase domain-containing protein [Paenibacillus aquistagni]|uniref:methyltransferase domain-containing protein n=1 Tax=Paenibacillus aquistagni TaxID=1852522 RepID=UPI00145C172A|nr:methyltransferase domain-containing protein [Paenibacillus aquistagni]NMM55492.1 methyltransferase domain-containing protein [Paenibacillus aquistagni]
MKHVINRLKKRLRIISFTDSVYDIFCDIRYGVETSKTDLLLDNQQLHFDYMPTSYHIINKLFKKYKFQPQDHLVDFGCGKARVILAAANYSCPTITGIEINPKMIKVAERNVDKFLTKKKNKSSISLKMEDAAKVEISRDMNKFFFFNPFHLKIFIYIINKITKSVQKNPREVILFFLWPKDSTEDLMESYKEYKLVEKFENGKYKYCVYKSII